MSNIEKRLAAVEAEVARLRDLLEEKARRPWWREIAGTFKDDPCYEKAMKLGRKYRDSTKPKSRNSKSADADS